MLAGDGLVAGELISCDGGASAVAAAASARGVASDERSGGAVKARTSSPCSARSGAAVAAGFANGTATVLSFSVSVCGIGSSARASAVARARA